MASDETIYSVHCPTCNLDQQKKMSFFSYIKYSIFDGITKGNHDINATLIPTGQTEPTVCPFGHDIDTTRTLTLNVQN